MTNEIVKHGGAQLPATRKERSSREDVALALAPMFALFPYANITEATVAAYVEHLIDIPLEGLRDAIRTATETCEFLPTVAHIRSAYRDSTMPGPRNDLTPEQIAMRRDVSNMRLWQDPDDTPAGRRERLRRTEKWSNRYGH